MGCSSCGPKSLTVEQMKNMSSEQIIAAYRAGYKLVQEGGAHQSQVMSQDWQYGGRVQSLAATCTKTTINGGETVNLAAAPNDGTAPYTVTFLAQFGGAPAVLSGAGLVGSATQTVTTDGGTTTAVTYTVSDAEIVASVGGAPAAVNVNGSGLDLLATVANSVRFIVHTSDSCPTGPLHCLESCTLAIVCTPPTCNFIVSPG